MPDPLASSDLPDPALVVLIGASGSGKSAWAATRYRTVEVVSSDALRAATGTGPADMSASTDAFAVLEMIVAARLGRRLTTVVDTVGQDPARRRGWLDQAHTVGLPAVAVIMDTAPRLCSERNARRDRRVPAAVLDQQLARMRNVDDELAGEGWDRVLTVTSTTPDAPPRPVPPVDPTHQIEPPAPTSTGLRFVLQLSRFPVTDDLTGWLRSMAEAADAAGFFGLALMDHLIQIPQVGRAWDPIPEPWVTLGLLAGLDTDLHLGTLVSPVTFREPGIIAKAGATLSALTGGRTFCGIGAGWWEREHAAYGLAFPDARTRLDRLERCLTTVRALWAPGTKAFSGAGVELPETTCYPRPAGPIPIIVGGSGERRTLAIAARLADGCNLLSASLDALAHKITVLHDHCDRFGRDPDEVMITVLDLPVLGRDREDVARRVERARGRTAQAPFVRQHPAGVASSHVDRYHRLRGLGVRTAFVAPVDLTGPDDLAGWAPITQALG